MTIEFDPKNKKARQDLSLGRMDRSDESIRRARALFEEIVKGETLIGTSWNRQVKDKNKKERRFSRELMRISVLKEKLARLLAQK